MSDDEKAWTPDPSQIRKAGESPPQPSAEELAAIEEMAKDHREMVESRLQVLDEWNRIESSLAEVIRATLNTPDPIIASIVYFTPHSFRTRTDMIGKLIDHMVKSHLKPRSLADDWKKLADRLNRKRDVRNQAAHGHIISYAEPGGKHYILLAPIVMQMDKYLEAYRDGKLPGSRVSDVKAAIDVAQKLKAAVETFLKDIRDAMATP